MNLINKSVLAGFLLVVMFAFSFIVASQNDYSGFCDEPECVISLVLETDDFSLCDSISEKDVCYSRLSRIYNDSSTCMNVSDSGSCVYDFALYNKDYNYCKGLGNLSDNCVFDVAVRLGDSSLCEVSENKNYCYYSFAIWSGDASLCEKSENYKNACIKKLLES